MALKKYSLRTTQDHQNRRLDHVLSEWLPIVMKESISKGKVRKLIMAGAVYLNGSRVRIASKNILSNAKIEVFINPLLLNQDHAKKFDQIFVMEDRHILFEDEFIIVVNKPPGLPTQPTLDEARDNLFQAVKKFLSEKNSVPLTQVYLGLHHRLDRDTSGVILFTKSKEANPGIAKEFSNHLAQKTYDALVSEQKAKISKLERNWILKNYLGKTSGSKGKGPQKFGEVRAGGDYAETEFQWINTFLESDQHAFHRIQARPKTGRTHQIRVHLSEQGLPILGDFLYQGMLEVPTSESRGLKIPSLKIPSLKIPRMMLHASQLELHHPISGKKLAIESPLPEDFNKVMNCKG